MRIIKSEILINAGTFCRTKAFRELHAQITEAIKSVEWPPGSGSFTLRNELGKERGKGSGVKPIKDACIVKLESYGWSKEVPLETPAHKRPGKVDAAIQTKRGLFCVEWETGNISSSHRALNKMSLGLLTGIVICGILIVPTREMYKYLTDRVGNFPELEPYFPVWKALPILDGFLEVIAIEHDALSDTVDRIPKGTDGRSLV